MDTTSYIKHHVNRRVFINIETAGAFPFVIYARGGNCVTLLLTPQSAAGSPWGISSERLLFAYNVAYRVKSAEEVMFYEVLLNIATVIDIAVFSIFPLRPRYLRIILISELRS